jgi:2-haloacid dehalogenase
MNGIRAILFDAYGTLFRLDSIETACATALASQERYSPTPVELSSLWRAKQLEYSVHRSMMGQECYVDFTTITAEALDYALARYAVNLSPAVRVEL